MGGRPGEREFIGTESRLNTIFELLRQSSARRPIRIAVIELRRRRAELDEEIARAERVR